MICPAVLGRAVDEREREMLFEVRGVVASTPELEHGLDGPFCMLDQ